jgi:hypothetical protein
MATYILHLSKSCTKQSLKASKVTMFETIVNSSWCVWCPESSFGGGYRVWEYKKVSWHEVRLTTMPHVASEVTNMVVWGTNCPTLEILAFSSKPTSVTVPECVHRICCSVLLLQAQISYLSHPVYKKMLSLAFHSLALTTVLHSWCICHLLIAVPWLRCESGSSHAWITQHWWTCLLWISLIFN